MSIHDLTFIVDATALPIYDPITVVSGVGFDVKITNNGTEDLTDLGFYLVPTTLLGEVDYPSNYAPHTDYQDMLTWGSASKLGVSPGGGIYLTCNQNSGTWTDYVTRDDGALLSNKIPFIDLAAGASEVITILLETPPAVSARRFYIDLVLE